MQEQQPKKRTETQNAALHLWFTQKADQCRFAGVTPKMAFEKTMELEMTPQIMKEIWHYTQKALYGKRSTTELKKQGEIDELVEHLNRFFADNFNLPGLAFPCDYEKHYNELSSIGYRK